MALIWPAYVNKCCHKSRDVHEFFSVWASPYISILIFFQHGFNLIKEKGWGSLLMRKQTKKIAYKITTWPFAYTGCSKKDFPWRNFSLSPRTYVHIYSPHNIFNAAVLICTCCRIIIFVHVPHTFTADRLVILHFTCACMCILNHISCYYLDRPCM